MRLSCLEECEIDTFFVKVALSRFSLKHLGYYNFSHMDELTGIEISRLSRLAICSKRFADTWGFLDPYIGSFSITKGRCVISVISSMYRGKFRPFSHCASYLLTFSSIEKLAQTKTKVYFIIMLLTRKMLRQTFGSKGMFRELKNFTLIIFIRIILLIVFQNFLIL